ncbi:hypothetical protein G3A_03975 [Bacillus sp. 17376]|uniref:Uncharacterized protein n=1 Tax=Mesobacillus boroniphilus JCM 21738 TaxID=1294265 RepID=W4RMX1_9BACI|nr:CBO0543 family protein [Mesobacillus boroniphilus]ESU33964.1 hypothetical protein G3A_03975 [Bacillus sp. 17376]GAE45666.1 hypothetical protein JCM21738_2494 [Mesobacillus boroniphilus JCM 21738]
MFHVVLIAGGVALSVGRGNWQRWKEFLPAFYFWALFSCFYEYISYIGNKHLWEFDENFMSLFVTETLYTFFLPSMIVLFLGGFPEERTKRFLYYLKWISLSVIIEAIALKMGAIKFAHGWSMGWEVFFCSTMYTMLRLHCKNPLNAFILSIFFVFFYLMIFIYQLV